jgi:hypothetical protein
MVNLDDVERRNFMKFLMMVLAASIGQIITLLLVQGFAQSYFGKQAREEITRIWDSMSKHVQKEKKNG